MDLPRGRDREHVHHRGHDYTLRGSESRTLSSVGAFRVIPTSHLRDTFDKPLDPRHGKLWHLRDAGLVQTVRLDRDHTVVTLTREGRDLLESRRWDREPDAPERDRQAFHDGVQRLPGRARLVEGSLGVLAFLLWSIRPAWGWPQRRGAGGGDGAMTFDERCAAVATLGFTERQARFLTTVMLHTGVCVPRQYARYCRIVHGQKTRKFFAKLVRLRYASMYDCRHNRAQLYHLNQRSLYAAIGQATSRLQRPLPLSHAIHRLMVLDAIVEDPEMVWLGTTEDKTAHLTALTSIAPEGLPHVTSGIGDRRTVRYFPDRLPIGVHLAGRGVVVYVVLARAWRQGRFRRRSSPEPGWSKRSNSGIGMDISPPWSPSPRRLPGFSPLATERA